MVEAVIRRLVDGEKVNPTECRCERRESEIQPDPKKYGRIKLLFRNAFEIEVTVIPMRKKSGKFRGNHPDQDTRDEVNGARS